MESGVDAGIVGTKELLKRTEAPLRITLTCFYKGLGNDEGYGRTVLTVEWRRNCLDGDLDNTLN